MYARPTLDDGTVPTFGVSGKLWRDSLVMYDRATLSLWSQVQGRAIAGPMAGAELEEVPVVQTTWAAWRAEHPDTLVLVKPALDGSSYERYHANDDRVGLFYSRARDDRLPPKELVYGFELAGKVFAVPVAPVREAGRLEVEVMGRTVVLEMGRSGGIEGRVGDEKLAGTLAYWAIWVRHYPGVSLLERWE